MNILLSIYTCEPGAGSESGVGWMVPSTMARNYPEYNIYVVTRSYSRSIIEEAMKKEQALNNLHFSYYDIPKWLTYPNEKNSNWGQQINYILWQLMSRSFMKELCKDNNIDVIHHLNFNQYRTPSPGFWMDIPFIIGPIGGAETIAPAFWRDLAPATLKKEKIRLKGRDLCVFRWLNNRRNNKKIILYSAQENIKRLQPYAGDSKCMLLPAIAIDIKDFATVEETKQTVPFTMIYAGRAIDWKGLRIFLRAARKGLIDNGKKDFCIKLIGIRFEEEQKLVSEWIEKEKLENNVEVIPFMQRSELLKEIAKCSLNIYPAFRDSGSMAVLEASALACPTICFNVGGQDAFPDDVLLKIDVDGSYEDILDKFAKRLNYAYTNYDSISILGQRSKEYVERELVWDKKVEKFVHLYKSLLS